MPLPSDVGGNGTGNALTDASLVSIGTAGVQVDPAQAAAAINTANQQVADLAANCLWPPSGQITFPIIPGLIHRSVSIPCLLSVSEARAVIGASILLAGLGIIGFIGIPVLAAVAAGDIVIAGIRLASGGSGAKPSGTPKPPVPEVPVPA